MKRLHPGRSEVPLHAVGDLIWLAQQRKDQELLERINQMLKSE